MSNGKGPPRPVTNQEEPLKVISARLPFWHIHRARIIGAGNLSEGIRRAIEQMKEVKK